MKKTVLTFGLINVALTFTEVFPIGLVVTLLSAGILRKKVRDTEN